MPIVKVQTFHKGGHHASCKERRTYLEKDSRHIWRGTLNVARPDAWDRELDTTRESYALRGNVTYREYVLSPSEQDNVSVVQMRELAWEWAFQNFPENEVVIVLHDDNRGRIHHGKEGIVHAHIVVNAIDLEHERKMNISNERVRELHNSAQSIAARMGLSRLDDYRPGERLRSHQEHQKTHAERQIELRGADGWKAVVRDMAIQAKEQSHSLREFQSCLRMADIDIRVKQNHIYLVDRENPDKAVRADKLDRNLSQKELAHTFKHSLDVDQRGKERIREKRMTAALKREIEHNRQIASSQEQQRKRFIADLRKEKAASRAKQREQMRNPKEKPRKQPEHHVKERAISERQPVRDTRDFINEVSRKELINQRVERAIERSDFGHER